MHSGGGGGWRAASGWPGGRAVHPQQDTQQSVSARTPAAPQPPPATRALTQDAVRVRSGGQGWTRLPQSSCNSEGSCLGLAGTTCPPLGLPWGAPGALGRKHRPGARNT